MEKLTIPEPLHEGIPQMILDVFADKQMCGTLIIYTSYIMSCVRMQRTTLMDKH